MRAPERLEPLLEHGVIQEVVRPLMSGKEAEVFLVLSGGEERVAKVYKNAQFRSFQNRADYTELTQVPGMTPVMASTLLDHRQRTGAFQSMDEVAEIIDVGPIADHVSIGGAETERTFAVVAMVDLTTDNVQPHYVDVSTENPASLQEVWGYTLRTDANGTVLGGTWDDNKKHPDFAWVPTYNPKTADSNGSENPFLVYGDLLDVMGHDLER